MWRWLRLRADWLFWLAFCRADCGSAEYGVVRTEYSVPRLVLVRTRNSSSGLVDRGSKQGQGIERTEERVSTMISRRGLESPCIRDLPGAESRESTEYESSWSRVLRTPQKQMDPMVRVRVPYVCTSTCAQSGREKSRCWMFAIYEGGEENDEEGEEEGEA